MDNNLFDKRNVCIILSVFCMCLLVCTFQNEKKSAYLETELDEKQITNGMSYRETEDLGNVIKYVENIEENIETESKNKITGMVCDKLQAIDFTIKEYQIDEEIYTKEMDREYKKVFLQVLLNQMPVQCENGEETYFEDIDSNKEKLNTDHITMIKDFFVYCYLDFDGDGLPELIVDPQGAYVRFGGPRIFKYDRDSKKVYVDGYRFMKYRPLCAGRFYYEDKGGASAIRYGYQEINSQGKIIEEATFQLVYPAYENPERYFITSVGEFENVNVEIDKESWDEMLYDFFEAKDNAVEEITFDEFFSDIEHP